MSNTITVIGNMTAPPELRFAASGSAWATFTVADNRKDRDGNESTTFIDCKAFGQIAENITAGLDKGTRVIVTGRMEQESWERDGQKRSKLVLMVDSIGPDLRFATAKVMRVDTVQTGSGRVVSTPVRSADPWAGAPEPVEPEVAPW